MVAAPRKMEATDLSGQERTQEILEAAKGSAGDKPAACDTITEIRLEAGRPWQQVAVKATSHSFLLSRPLGPDASSSGDGWAGAVKSCRHLRC